MAETFKGWERQLNLQVVPHVDGTTVRFGDTGHVCLLKSETVASFADTGHPCFVRLQFHWPAVQSGISKDHHFVFLTWQGGAAVGYTKDLPPELFRNEKITTRIEISATKLDSPHTRHGLQHPFRVDIYENGKEITDLRERFYFPCVPLEAASLDAKKQVQWLADCVGNLLKRERQQFRAMAQAQQTEQLQKFPPRNPAKDYGKPDFDHYANQREVLVKLLCVKWPQLSKAMAEFSNAKTAGEKADKQTAVWLGYIADHKSLFKKLPDVNEKEFADVLLTDKWHDHYIRLMSEAINAVSQGDKRDWQLAIGWIEKNYYRMSESELEVAFARDWNYKPSRYKGHALARRAHNLGLVSYLTTGPKKQLRTK